MYPILFRLPSAGQNLREAGHVFLSDQPERVLDNLSCTDFSRNPEDIKKKVHAARIHRMYLRVPRKGQLPSYGMIKGQKEATGEGTCTDWLLSAELLVQILTNIIVAFRQKSIIFYKKIKMKKWGHMHQDGTCVPGAETSERWPNTSGTRDFHKLLCSTLAKVEKCTGNEERVPAGHSLLFNSKVNKLFQEFLTA